MNIYVIQTSDKKYLKVGVAGCCLSRLKQLQTGNPQKLLIITTYEYESSEQAFKMEKIIHKKLKSKRLTGEWFNNVTPRDIERIILANRI